MARRLALLALLACAVAVRRPPTQSYELSDSESADPFALLDDYEESFETTPRPKPRTTKSSAKVILRTKGPQVNVTIKDAQGDDSKQMIKTTNINIQSHTHFIVTKRPAKPNLVSKDPLKLNSMFLQPQNAAFEEEEEPWMWFETSDTMEDELEPSTRRPISTTSRPVRRTSTTSRRPPTTSRRPATTSRRPTTTSRRPPSTRRPTSSRRPTPSRRPAARRSPTTRRPPTTQRPETTTRRRSSSTTTRRTTTRPPRRSPKTTKAPQTKRTTCPPKNSAWLSSFFNDNKLKKAAKKPARTGWFTGLFSRIFDWISRSSWFGGDGWFQQSEAKQPTTSTTIAPLTTASWFQNLLETEDIDGAYAQNDASEKPAKKSLKKNYKGYQLLRTYPDVQWKVQEMLEFQEDAQGSGIMWWTPPSLNGSTDLLVPPDLLADVKDHLKSAGIDFDVVIWDLQKAITYENPRLSKKQRLELEQLRGHPMTWRRYHRYADILRYLEYLQHSHSEIVELVPLGRSSEGLPLVAVKISLPSNETHTKDSVNKKKKWKLRSRMKPAVWIDGGAHAREWIAPAVASWMIHALVEGEKGQGTEMELLKQADFYIMPVLNPDGYEHSHTHDRLWRKTRSRLADHADDYYVGWFPWNWGKTECVGVDIDRNWDYHWGEHDSSRDPCSDNFAGPHPFSEPETRAVSEFLLEHRGQIKVYISLHAYSQAWLIPSTHAHTAFADDDNVQMEMGKLATAALTDLYGTKYQVGTVADIRQPASGMAHDWAKVRAGIKYSYHVDLRDTYGPYGFLLPGAQIVATARETWQGIKAIVDNLTPQ